MLLNINIPALGIKFKVFSKKNCSFVDEMKDHCIEKKIYVLWQYGKAKVKGKQIAVIRI